MSTQYFPDFQQGIWFPHLLQLTVWLQKTLRVFFKILIDRIGSVGIEKANIIKNFSFENFARLVVYLVVNKIGVCLSTFIEEKRRLEHQKLNDIVFVRYNLRLQNRYYYYDVHSFLFLIFIFINICLVLL